MCTLKKNIKGTTIFVLIRVLTISCHYQNIISNLALPPPGVKTAPGGTEFKFEVTFCITCAVYTPIDKLRNLQNISPYI